MQQRSVLNNITISKNLNARLDTLNVINLSLETYFHIPYDFNDSSQNQMCRVRTKRLFSLLIN